MQRTPNDDSGDCPKLSWVLRRTYVLSTTTVKTVTAHSPNVHRPQPGLAPRWYMEHTCKCRRPIYIYGLLCLRITQS